MNLELYVKDLRQALHRIPELGWQETKTIALLLSEIHHAISFCNKTVSPTLHEAKGGFWVDLIVDKALPTLLFRADIDGLPIQEETGLAYSSIHNGLMHACGHDCHAAMLMGAFQAIARGFVTPKANLRFVWQRAEETGGSHSGGQILVSEGVCEGVSQVFGLHISAVDPLGLFLARPGIAMANSASLHLTITCSGGHVMHPEAGDNAIQIMTDIHHSLHGFERAFFGPQEPIAFVPTMAHSGVAYNIRPNQAKLSFALRNFLPHEERNQFIQAISNRVTDLVSRYPTAKISEFILSPGYPPLINDEESCRSIGELLINSGYQVKQPNLLFCGEDFSYYLQEKPGSFWGIGANDGTGSDHHTATFNPDESCLKIGVDFWLLLAQSYPNHTLVKSSASSGSIQRP